jgi:hypothetical protein
VKSAIRHKCLLIPAVVALLCTSALLVAQSQLVLYDDFNSRQIDAAKWIGVGGDPDLRDAARIVSAADDSRDRQLELSERAYADTLSDNSSRGGVFGLGFPQPSVVNDVAFRVRINSTVALACPTNPGQDTLTGAEFRGRFFNTETSPNSEFGDVYAVISLTRHSSLGSGLHVEAFVQHCDDQFCGAQTSLGFNDLGVVVAGQTTSLHLKWDRLNHQFIFQMNNKAPVSSPYTVPDMSAPFLQVKSIELARVVPNCTSSPRPAAAIDAVFDNVLVNR